MGIQKISWIAAIFTLVTYYQNVGVIISFAPDAQSSSLDRYLSFFYRTLDAVTALISQIPPLDLRFQLAFMSIIIPLLLDMVFVWFICAKLKVYFHYVDSILLFGVSYGIALYFFQPLPPDKVNSTAIFIAGACGVLLFLRILIYLATHQTQAPKRPLKFLAHEICGCLLCDALTRRASTQSLDDINKALVSYSDIIEILPSLPKPGLTILMFFLSVILLGGSIWDIGGWEILGFRFPAAIALFFPIIGIPFGSVFLVVFIMRLSNAGRSAITAIKRVLRRYGLSVVLTLLRLLYLPVIKLIVDLVVPTATPCPMGTIMNYTFDSSSIYTPFINRSFECTPCADCVDTALRVCGEPGLIYMRDLWLHSWSLIAFAGIAIALGVPALSWFVVSTNKAIVSCVMVFGHDSEEKWNNVLERLNSTGVTLFVYFKYSGASWALVQLLTGFLVGAIPLLMTRLHPGLIYLFPGMYVVLALITGIKRPYRYRVNNAIEALGFLCLAGFAIVPCLRYQSIHVTSQAETIATGLAMAAPFLGFFAFLGGNERQIAAEDPTIPTKEMEAEIKKRKKKQKKQKFRLKQFTCADGEDQIRITYRELQSVGEQFRFEKGPGVAPTDTVFVASRIKLVTQIARMYSVIDVLLDGATTNLITRVLCAAVMMGFLALGMYVGTVTNVVIPAGVE
jgi:hypothetical protein